MTKEINLDPLKQLLFDIEEKIEEYKGNVEFWKTLPHHEDPQVMIRRNEVFLAASNRLADTIAFSGWLHYFFSVNNIPLEDRMLNERGEKLDDESTNRG